MTSTVVLATLTDLMRGGMLTLLLAGGGYAALSTYRHYSRKE